jgi:hypothetical protein
MLDSHPLMAVPPESYFVAQMATRRRAYEPDGTLDLDRFVADLESNPRYQKWGLDPERLRTALEPRPRGLAEALRRVFQEYANSYGKPRYADKTPSYVQHIPLLAALFPDARFVHVIRDGRDVALSFRRLPFGPDTLDEAALFWRSRTLTGRRAGAALGPQRYFEVHYEDLAREPEKHLQQICEFVDIPYDPAMLRFNEHADRLMATGVPGAHERLASPPALAARTWRDQLNRSQIRRFEVLAGDALTSFGYEVTSDRPHQLHRSAARVVGRASAYRAAARRRLRRFSHTSDTAREDR